MGLRKYVPAGLAGIAVIGAGIALVLAARSRRLDPGGSSWVRHTVVGDVAAWAGKVFSRDDRYEAAWSDDSGVLPDRSGHDLYRGRRETGDFGWSGGGSSSGDGGFGGE
ncbi:hypothetical protein [Actinorhabdospora filicis]|nr:hypothetical protein [Actinorhabdospora filicis]